MLRRNLPNYITLGNLAMGCIGIQLILTGRPDWAPWCIVIAAALDFLDGAAARLLNAHSAIGKDLDSLADVVSFGVLPGFLAWELTLTAASDKTYLSGDEPLMYLFRFVFLFIPLLSAWRLARFNNDPGQSVTFRGLPTPANALFWAGLAFGIYSEQFDMLYQPWILTGLILIMSILLVVNMPMFSLKFQSSRLKENLGKIFFLLACIPLFLIYQMSALCPVILLYILVSALMAFDFSRGASRN